MTKIRGKDQGGAQPPGGRRHRARAGAASTRRDWHRMTETERTRHLRVIAARIDESARRATASRDALKKLRLERQAKHKVTKDRWSEIEARCRLVYEFEQVRPRDAAVEMRIAQIRRIHADLWSVNLRIELVDKLNEKHVRALLDLWRSKLSRATAKLLWAALGWWVEHALGKDRKKMVRPLTFSRANA